MLRKLAFLLSLSINLSGITFADTTPMPTIPQTFQYSSPAYPVKSTDPAQAKPISITSMTTGGNTLSIRIGLNQFPNHVDIYFGIYAPSIDPNNVYILKSDYGLQPLSKGLEPWKRNTTAEIDERLFGDIPISSLPPGTYYVYLLIAPAHSLDKYYLWTTSFVIVQEGTLLIESPLYSKYDLDYYITADPMSKKIHMKLIIGNINQSTYRLLNPPIRTEGPFLADYMTNISATDQNGVNLSFLREGENWTVNTSTAKQLVFEYDLPEVILYDSRKALIIAENGGYAWGRYLFVVPENSVLSIRLQFNLPSNWHAATSFKRIGENIFEIECDKNTNIIDLLSDAYWFGSYSLFGTCNLNVSYFLYQWQDIDVNDYVDIVQKMVDSAANIFGEVPFNRYNIVDISGVPGEFKYVGWNGWIQIWPTHMYDVTAHHIMHAWIFFERNAALQFWGTNATGWFLEGIPTYYQGIIAEEAVGRSYPLTPEKDYYDYAMKAKTLDNKIREVTGGQKNLKNLLAVLYQKYYRIAFYDNEMISALNELTGIDLTSFYWDTIAK